MPEEVKKGDPNCKHQWFLEEKKATGRGGKKQETHGGCLKCDAIQVFKPEVTP